MGHRVAYYEMELSIDAEELNRIGRTYGEVADALFNALHGIRCDVRVTKRCEHGAADYDGCEEC